MIAGTAQLGSANSVPILGASSASWLSALSGVVFIVVVAATFHAGGTLTGEVRIYRGRGAVTGLLPGNQEMLPWVLFQALL